MSSSEEEYRPSGKNKSPKKVSGKKGGKPEKPVKLAKDPNKPKAPLSSYMRFVSEKRASIREEHPDAGIGEIAKVAGAMWREVSDEDKSGYEQAYLEERKEYNIIMESYVAPPGCIQLKRSKSKNKDPNAPKKPMTAYFLWMNQNRDRIKKENPDATLGEVSKIAGTEWKDVDADEKAELDSLYRSNVETYKKTMQNYKPDKNYAKEKTSPKKKSKPVPKKKAKKTAEIYDDSSDDNAVKDGDSTSSLNSD